MKRILLAALRFAGVASAGPSLAQQSKVGDWTIEKRTQDTHCNASRGYKDKDDRTATMSSSSPIPTKPL